MNAEKAEGYVVTSKSLELDEARREIRKVLKATNMTVEELLEDIKEEREGLYQEIYRKTTDNVCLSCCRN